VYYQSLEAIVAKKFLGNLADTDMDFCSSPASSEDAATAGVPPWSPRSSKARLQCDGGAELGDPSERRKPRECRAEPRRDLTRAGARHVYTDAVPKASFPSR